jgi:hypothetical protein
MHSFEQLHDTGSTANTVTEVDTTNVNSGKMVVTPVLNPYSWDQPSMRCESATDVTEYISSDIGYLYRVYNVNILDKTSV